MGLIAPAVKTVIHLGGGQGWMTATGRDILYASPWEGENASAITADQAMSFIPFFAAVRLISEDLATLPLGVFQKLEKGRQARSDHWLDALLSEQANPYMDAMTFRETLQAHVLTWGNGYAEKEYATDGTILNLWPLRPDRMEVLMDTSVTPGRVFYRYQKANGERVDLPKRKVFHVHGLGFDGLVGYSVISKAGRTLAMAVKSEKYNAGYLDKGVLPPAVLTHPATLSEAARQRLGSDWHGLDHRDRVAILEEGLKLEVIGIPPKDLPLVETFGHSRSLMATLFRLPPEMLSDVERSTSWGTGIEQQNLGYVVRSLRAWLVRWEQAGRSQLLTDEPRDLFLRHNVDAFLRGDARTRWAVYEIATRIGAYCIDDVLELEDRNPLPNGQGQKRFVQLNMAPLDQALEMTLKERLELLRGLTLAGFKPESVESELDLPPIAHTGLEPTTVAEQGEYIEGPNGQHPVVPAEVIDAIPE